MSGRSVLIIGLTYGFFLLALYAIGTTIALDQLAHEPPPPMKTCDHVRSSK